MPLSEARLPPPSRRFSPLTPIFDSGHEDIAFEAEEQIRKGWREKKSTPAMRMKLANTSVRLDTILYGKWPKMLLTPKKKVADIPRSTGRRSPSPSALELDHSIPF